MSAEGWLEAAIDVATRGADEALARFRCGIGVDDKDEGERFDPVTEADRAAERAMRAAIQARYPDHGILGEEYGEVAGEGARWVLDPIDGTRGFVSGTPTWTTLVGVEIDEGPVLGVIRQPFTDETWWAGPVGAGFRQAGADRPLATSGCERLARARIATTDPRAKPAGAMTAAESRAFLALAEHCPVARFGLDAYAYGLLAAGHLDLVVESELEIYDVAALVPVVRGAGGVITSWTGGDPSRGGTVVAAATPALHAAALAHLG